MTAPDAVPLSAYLHSRRAEIDEALRQVLPSAPACPSMIAESMRYSLFAGGKRFRPVLTLAAAEAVAGDGPHVRRVAMPAACAVEIIHTYSLIHDDLPAMDNDVLRRGKPTLHVVYGEGMAILAGDGLLTEAFALLARDAETAGDATRAARTLAVMGRLASAAGALGMVGGQAIDLHAAGHGHDGALTPDGLRDMHARKTGALIRAAAVAGAIVAGGTTPEIAAVDEYAAALGLAFQIVDDILDVEGAGDALGKTVGKDAAADKPTYPAYFGLGESKRMARAAADGAREALRCESLHQSRLADIAAWVISRTS